MVDENEFHRRVKEDLDALGGRPLHPEGAELLGGLPLSAEARMMAKRKHVGFLGGDGIGEWSIDKEIKRKYKDFPAVKSATFYEHGGVVKGSNPFYIVAVNEMLGEGKRTATQADLEKIRKSGALDFSGVFVDTALVLRSVGRPNKYLAEDLAKQIRARDLSFPTISNMPVMIPLAGLKLEPDQNSRHGLAFKLKEDADVIYAPPLDHENDGRRFSKTDDKYGLSIFDKDGDRFLHTRDSGLARLYSSEGDNLYSDFNYLACSGAYGAGRVVVVSDKD